MLQSTTLVTMLWSLMSLAYAAPPTPGQWGHNQSCGSQCMTAQNAYQVAMNFQALITTYSDTLADTFLAADFVDYSDSVAELINSGCMGPQPLGEPTFSSLDSFKEGQGSQPSIPFEILNVWNNCNTVTLRWRSPQTPEIITGIIVLEIDFEISDAAFPWKISTVYSEFNSGAWLVNLGIFEPSNCIKAV